MWPRSGARDGAGGRGEGGRRRPAARPRGKAPPKPPRRRAGPAPREELPGWLVRVGGRGRVPTASERKRGGGGEVL